jgi:hypothetical protein
MSKLYDVERSSKDRLKAKKHKNRRFLSQLDMSIIKHDIAVKNSEIKRGERESYAMTGIYMCSCGGAGCAIHYDKK